MKSIAGLASIVALCAVGFIPTAAQAQIPDEFTNLQLLPEDTSRGQIIGIMRDWSSGLGVRCNHCHVGPEDLQGMDFASDEKATKRTARKMLEMARELNGNLLEDLPVVADGERQMVVSCFTCHRGLAKPPRNIEVVLSNVYSADGIDATVAEYRKLRDEHYGAGRYDFRAAKLNSIASNLVQGDRAEDALEILALNLEFDPDNADAHAGIGAIQLQAGNFDLADASFEEALRLDPDNWMATQGAQQLEAAREGAVSKE